MRWSSWGRGTCASFWSRSAGAAPAFWEMNQPLEPLAGRPHRPFSRPQIINAAFTDADRPGVVDAYVHYLRRQTEPEIVRDRLRLGACDQPPTSRLRGGRRKQQPH